MDKSNLRLCLIRNNEYLMNVEHRTKIARVKILTKHIAPTHRTPGPPIEVSVVRDHGG